MIKKQNINQMVRNSIAHRAREKEPWEDRNRIPCSQTFVAFTLSKSFKLFDLDCTIYKK